MILHDMFLDSCILPPAVPDHLPPGPAHGHHPLVGADGVEPPAVQVLEVFNEFSSGTAYSNPTVVCLLFGMSVIK